MVQGDIHPGNFLIDPDTRQITLIDFATVSALPESFVDFTLRATRDDFVKDLRNLMSWKQSDNYRALLAAKFMLRT